MENPIYTLLVNKGIPFKASGRDFVVKCFNPDHEDSNPSMRIDQLDGKFHCLSCGYKGSIFKYFGIISTPSSIKVAKLKEKLKVLRESVLGLELPDGATPVTTSFRGISRNTLQKFGAFSTDRVEDLTDRIIFPIKDITGNTVVFVGRHTLSQGNPRYLNYPRGVRIPLFPAILEGQQKSMVLVEGIFDMLNCYDKGLTNVVCSFGTNTLQSETKQKLLPFKAQGVETIYIMYDGDEAGIDATKKIKPLLEELEFKVEIITLQEDVDPGMLSQDEVTSIKEYIIDKDSTYREMSK